MGTSQRSYLFPGDVESDTFRVEVSSNPVPVSAIPSLATADYPAMATEFKQFKEACWIDPPRFMGVHYAQFEAQGPVSVSIVCPTAVKSYIIHPLRREVRPVINGTRITLAIGDTQPRYYILEIDEYPPLVIIIEAPISNAPRRDADDVLDIGTLVTDSGSVAERTAAFHQAFTDASKSGKTVYVPAGVYHVNALEFHNLDGLKVYFAPGSLIRTEVSPPGKNIHSHGLWFQDSKNIHITGRGCLDHQGFGNFAHGRNAYNHGLISYYVSNDLCPWLSESPVFMMRCSNITMEGFMVRNGRNMNYNIRRSDDVILRNCKIMTPPASCPEYTDGYHTNSCRNVLIENCLAFCNDDCFASGHYTYFDDRESGLHTIRGLVGWNIRANGIRLGFYTFYNQGDYHFENCDIAGYTWMGLMIHPLKDADEANRYQWYGTVSLTNCGFDGARSGAPLIQVDGARMVGLEIVDCTFDGDRPFQIHGHDPNGQVKRLVIRNVRVAGHVVDVKSANLDAANIGS